MSDTDRPRRRLLIALIVAAAGVVLAWTFENVGTGWVGRYRSTLISAIWLYLPLPFVLRSKNPASHWGLSFGTGFRGILETLAVSVAVLIPFYLAYFTVYPARWFQEAFSRQLLEVALAQFLAVSIPEEFFFRGYLQSELESGAGRKWRILGADVGLGWLAASAIFALAHVATMPIPGRAAVFFPALLFGWTRARTKSVLHAAIMHWLFNVTFLIAQRMAV